MATHYEILGVGVRSEPEVIEAAYKRLIKKYHPDRAGDNRRVRQINAAYAVLKDPLKRKAYDATLISPHPADVAVEPTASRSRPREAAGKRPPRNREKTDKRVGARRPLGWLLLGVAALFAWALIFGG